MSHQFFCFAPSLLLQSSLFAGPVSARVRGLFIKHTKTGNPLVDSVAEHQATPTRAYWRYFHIVMYLAPIGLVSLFMKKEAKTESEWFTILYSVIAWYFSQKMIRLVLILAPAAAVCGGQVSHPHRTLTQSSPNPRPILTQSCPQAVCMIVGWSIEKVQTGSSGQGEQNADARAKAEARES